MEKHGLTGKKLAIFSVDDAFSISSQLCRGDVNLDPLEEPLIRERFSSNNSSRWETPTVSAASGEALNTRPARRRNLSDEEVNARKQREDQQKEYWSRELYLELKKFEAPALQHLEHCVSDRHLHMALAGRTRYNTLKRYVKTWMAFMQWLEAAKGVIDYPVPGDLVEYLFSRFDEPCGPTIPGLIVKAVTWMERTACIDDRMKVGESQVVLSVKDYIVEMLSKDSPPKRRAPRYPAVFLEALEVMVENDTLLMGTRAVAWIKLFKIWASLRWDDIQKVVPKELKYYAGRMTTILRITKTTGPTKRVQELPVCVSEHAYVTSPFWLKTGFDLFKTYANFERDYMLPKLNRDWSSFRRSMATYNDVTSYSSYVRKAAKRPGTTEPLLDPSLSTFWTEHSERATLPTGLALLRTAKEERDMLGRWKPDGSDTYIRMYNGVVARLQQQYAKAVRVDNRTGLLDERDVIESAMSWLTDRCEQLPENQVQLIISHLEDSMRWQVQPGWELTGQVEEEDVPEDTQSAPNAQPLQVQKQQTEKDALKRGGADLRFTLSRNDVTDDLQAAFFTNGITTVQKFSSFFRSEEDLIQVMKDSFATDADDGLEARAQLASVICAWRETQTKQKRQAEVEAEMDTREWTKPIPTGDYINLRNAFMRAHGKVEDKVTPSKEYLEKKLQELKNGEFRAELLSEVVSKDEVDPDIMVPVFDSKGSLSVKKGTTTVALPTGPEQLRRRLTVMLHCVMMLALKHTNREEIQDMSRDTMERYKDYILGDYVWGLSSTDLQGNQIQTPPWSLVLSYEHAVRKRAYNLMVTEHLRIGAALEQAWKCPVTKERHFITPLALYSKRSNPRRQGAFGHNRISLTYGYKEAQRWRTSLLKVEMVDIQVKPHLDLTQKAVQDSDRQNYEVLKPDGRKLAGGLGSPRKCQPPGKDRSFHDGAGLLSMGRWDVEQRIWSKGVFWERLRKGTIELIEKHLGDERALDRAGFEMAVRGEAGCNIVRDEKLKSDIRLFWIDLLRQHGSKQEGLDHVAPGQPFHLRLMKELLAFGEDADREFLMQGEVGYPVGVLTPLPRTPHCYEEQTTWRLEDDPHMQEEVWRSNYQSVGEHVQFVREHFTEECAEGLMERLTLEQAKTRFGDKIAISSLAVLVEQNHQGKKRVIHDATHGTKLNNRIRCRDKTRSPSAREKQYLLAYFQENKCSVFSLVGDISKAHRRFLHAPGAGIRLVHELLGPQMPVELLLFADDLEALGASAGGRRGITLAFLYMSVLGFPFKWTKQRGGLRVEWIGLFSDYSVYKLGLSPSRARWMHDWVKELADTGTTTAKNFEQGLGRLGFAAMALTWERPFLGPLYSWCAAIRTKRGALRVPAMLRTILRFLAKRFLAGGDLQCPPPLKRQEGKQVIFYTDAKATEESAWIGGFKQGTYGKVLAWFSEEVPLSWAPWLKLKRDPKRIIAALELLASLVAVKLWMQPAQQSSEAVCWLKGKTDNQSNTYALTKWMSTKFPLTIFIMEMSESLRLGRCNLTLDWVPREWNQLADDLTNQKFDKFSLQDRIRWDRFQQEWLVLEEFMAHANSFHDETRKRKSEPQVQMPRKRKRVSSLKPW
ncbi:unnamed protein product [Cladocopium goreaui]|uniref:Sulfur deprivation response regulator n=1 Tax=Cladocopium goreaui TaxID=2562237 RepID=A0A9P1M5U0_9DINO|nr:unnamed protein product [Cladocopium goreaui]